MKLLLYFLIIIVYKKSNFYQLEFILFLKEKEMRTKDINCDNFRQILKIFDKIRFDYF